MKKCILSLLILVIIPAACTQAPSLEQRIEQMVAAHNQHNVTKELSFFADDAVFIIPGLDPAVGKTMIRDVLECDSVLNSELVFQGFVVRGDTVIVNSITVRWDFFRLCGIPEVHYSPGNRIVFRKGLIQKLEHSPLIPEEDKAIGEFFSGMMPWLQVTHPDLVQEFNESLSLPHHSVKAAQMWVKLLTEYQASKSSEHK